MLYFNIKLDHKIKKFRKHDSYQSPNNLEMVFLRKFKFEAKCKTFTKLAAGSSYSSSNRILFKSSNIYQFESQAGILLLQWRLLVFFYVEEGKLVNFSREMADFLLVLACYCFYF